MADLDGKKVVLGVSGGIAAYKSPDLVRRLRERGAEVQVVITPGAAHFVGSLSFQAVSGRPVRGEIWDEAAEAAMGHIELARWADLVLVAPASADFIARLAAGLADDLLATLCLATEAPLVLAPAMNRAMWSNPATGDNVARLQARGVLWRLGDREGTFDQLVVRADEMQGQLVVRDARKRDARPRRDHRVDQRAGVYLVAYRCKREHGRRLP